MSEVEAMKAGMWRKRWRIKEKKEFKLHSQRRCHNACRLWRIGNRQVAGEKGKK